MYLLCMLVICVLSCMYVWCCDFVLVIGYVFGVCVISYALLIYGGFVMVMYLLCWCVYYYYIFSMYVGVLLNV